MRISLGDVSLWFDVSGPSVIPHGDTTVERPVLVAVHGGPGLDHMTVKPALEPLASDFQVLYFDLRGHGRSDRSSAEFWNMRTWADDLRRLCDALEPARRRPVPRPGPGRRGRPGLPAARGRGTSQPAAGRHHPPRAASRGASHHLPR